MPFSATELSNKIFHHENTTKLWHTSYTWLCLFVACDAYQIQILLRSSVIFICKVGLIIYAMAVYGLKGYNSYECILKT